jgi:hypothetical protein
LFKHLFIPEVLTPEKDVKLVVFEGEGHRFDMVENRERAIEEEEALWRQTLVAGNLQ